MKFVVTAKAKSKIKDALKEEKRKIAEEGKYTLQRKLEGMGAAFNQHNIDELVYSYKVQSPLDLFYQIAVKKIDLKELKEFKVVQAINWNHQNQNRSNEIKPEISTEHYKKKIQNLSFLVKAVIRLCIHWPIAVNLFPAMMYLVL